MNALIRAALVGAVIGLVQDLLLNQVLGNEFYNYLVLMVFVPLPASMLLCVWGRLPSWPAVSILGSAGSMVSLLVAQVRLLDTPPLGEWGGRLLFMGFCAGAYACAAALVVPVRLPVRLSVIGTIIAAGLGGLLVIDNVAMLTSTRAMAAARVPVIAPDLRDHRLTGLDREGGTFQFSYERRHDGLELLVSVKKRDGLTLRQICENGFEETKLRCQEETAGRWFGTVGPDMYVFAAHGDAAVELYGEGATKADLLAVASALRPVSGWDLAWHS